MRIKGITRNISGRGGNSYCPQGKGLALRTGALLRQRGRDWDSTQSRERKLRSKDEEENSCHEKLTCRKSAKRELGRQLSRRGQQKREIM